MYRDSTTFTTTLAGSVLLSISWGAAQAQLSQTITVQSSQVAANLTDYPVYVDLSDLGATFFSTVEADGSDLFVTFDDGTTPLDRELVALDKTGHTGELYFRAPSVSATSNTEFQIHWGAAGGNTNSRGTWGPQFDEVWHFQGDQATCCVGATINAVEKDGIPGEFNRFRNGFGSNPTYGAAGLFGGGVDFPGQDPARYPGNANTTQDHLLLLAADANNLAADTVTIVSWTKIPADANLFRNWVYSARTNAGFAPGVLDLGHWEANDPQNVPEGTPFWQWFDNNEIKNIGRAPDRDIDDGEWHQLVGVVENITGGTGAGAGARLYIDGQLFVSADAVTFVGEQSNNHWISSQGDTPGNMGNLELGGILDELRLMNEALSADDILTLYNNQNSPETFYVVGPSPPAPITFTWDLTGQGNWRSNSSWNPSASPNDPNHTAIFGDRIVRPSTVRTDDVVTVNRIEFSSATQSYAVAGLGVVNLVAATETTPENPSIGVQGSHQFQAVVQLNDTTDVDVAAGASLAFNNALNIGANTLNKRGDGTLTINNSENSGSGTVAGLAGTISGVGLVSGDLNNSGATVAPGNSAGTLEVGNNYTQEPGATLQIEIGGGDNSNPSNQQFDVLDVTGQVTINGGTLDVDLINSFHPGLGNDFDILDFSSAGGIGFGTFDLQPLNVGLRWDVSKLLVDGTLSVVLTGGTNGADFLNIQRGFRVTHTAQDFADWKANFGTGTGSGSVAVPESATFVLAASGLLGLMGYQNRRRRGARSNRMFTLPTLIVLVQASGLLAGETNLERAQRVHQEATIVFAHTHEFELAAINDMRSGGVTAQVMKLTTDGIDWANRRRFNVSELTGWTQRYLGYMNDVLDIVAEPASNAMVIRNVSDFQTAKDLGAAGVIFGSEGARHLEGNIDNVQMFYDLGVREMQLFWPAGNQLFSGDQLTDFGRQVIDEANRLGILIDIGHTTQLGGQAFLDIIVRSTAPVISSHDVPNSIGNGDMNDQQVIAVANSGGGRGVYALHGVDVFFPDGAASDVESVVDVIDYLDNLIGIDHIALGPDWFPEDGWDWTFFLPDTFDLTLALVNRGYSDEDVKKVLGVNMIRLFDDVWVDSIPPTTFTWNLTGQGNWNNLASWSPSGNGAPPNSPDQTAIFGDKINGPSTVSTDEAITVNRIELNNSTHSYAVAGLGDVNLAATSDQSAVDPTISVQGSHQFQARVNLQNDTTVEVNDGSSLVLNNVVDLMGNTLTKTGAGELELRNEVLGSGAVVFVQGTVSGKASFSGDVTNSGAAMSPGEGSGVMRVEGDYTQSSDGALLIEIAGDALGEEYDVLLVDGTANLAGTLQVTLLEGFDPQRNDHFSILDFAKVTGAFDYIRLPELTDGLAWHMRDLYDGGTLSVIPEPSCMLLLLIGTGGIALRSQKDRGRARRNP